MKKIKDKKPVVAKRKEKVNLKPITDVARFLGIKKQYLENYGPYKAKISLDLLRSLRRKKQGKYILVSSITPTPLGEGKTVTAIGLSMAFNKLKKKAVVCLMQPALGGIFGIKGTASGGGAAQVLPSEDVNLHLTGDTHAVESAHNLCAAYLENSTFKGNPMDIDTASIIWRRALDTNDRSLRNVNIGLGSKTDGTTRKVGFEIVDSSEIMAILALSDNIKDMRERLGKVILGFNKKGKPVKTEDIKVAGAMAALLKDAIKPNLLQTREGTPCFMHTGAPGDTSLGVTSVVADKIALGLCEYVITESAFGADLGAEKFFDIKCRAGGLTPDVAVLVCSVRGLKMHSGDVDVVLGRPLPKDIFHESVSAVERGLSNLEKQVENLTTFGIPVVVCINRMKDDTDKEITAITRRVATFGAAGVAVSDAWAQGSEGAMELASAVISACKTKHSFRFLYPTDMPIKDKIKRIAKTLYGAREVKFSDEANKKVLDLKKLKLDNLPICMVKTHLSLSNNPKRKGRPHGFKLPVDDIRIFNGAGFIAAFCGSIKRIPGLPKVPRGTKIDITEEGKITGLF
ncbi:MAG: formate--tetrahydrofolate ligase [Candidatus Omnitrophica bacterium]|nr:formate--tetrahydrofolate ligase [Candidatus Omnitrophota bacterium]